MKRKSCYLILALSTVLLYGGIAQAIPLFKSNTLELYSIAAENGAVNDHPAVGLDTESLARLLASIQIRSDQEDKPVYLMEETAAPDAAQELSHALRRVDDRQDIHLVIYRSVGGLLNTRRLATGIRVFYQDGYLNMIFGPVDQFQDEFSLRKRNGKPVPSGSRSQSRLAGGSIEAENWFQFKEGRRDWILYPLEQTSRVRPRLRIEEEPAAVAPAPEPAQAAPTPEPAQPRQALPPPQEPSQPRSRVAEPDSSPAFTGESRQPEAAPAKPPRQPTSRWQDLEEGLETLQRLRDKNLISEEEFQSKRRELLDSVKVEP